MQIFDLSARLVAEGKGDVLLTAVYVGQELRGALSNARFLRVFEHGTLSGSDVISEFIHVTSKKQAKGVVCTPLGPVILERRLLAVLPPDADKVNLAEGLWLAIFFLLLGAWVLNTSPTGSDQRFLVESWNGTVALAEQLGTATLERRGVLWAKRSSIEDDGSAFMRRALAMTRRLLQARCWIGKDGVPVAPAIPAIDGQSAEYSWQQCFDALIGHRATRKARYALWAMSCSDPDCRDQVKSPVCVHGLYAMHRHIQLGREPCIRCSDHEMYFAPPATTESSVARFPSAVAAAVTASPLPTSNAERLLQIAASVSSLALQIPSLYGSNVGAAAFGAGGDAFLSPQDRHILDSASGVLHRLAMQLDKSLHATGSSTSFAGSRTSQRRLQTAGAVAHAHAVARGVEAADPGPVGLLRRQVALLQSTAAGANESDVSLIAHAAQEGGAHLSAFVSKLGVVIPSSSRGGSLSTLDVPAAAAEQSPDRGASGREAQAAAAPAPTGCSSASAAGSATGTQPCAGSDGSARAALPLVPLAAPGADRASSAAGMRRRRHVDHPIPADMLDSDESDDRLLDLTTSESESTKRARRAACNLPADGLKAGLVPSAGRSASPMMPAAWPHGPQLSEGPAATSLMGLAAPACAATSARLAGRPGSAGLSGNALHELDNDASVRREPAPVARNSTF